MNENIQNDGQGQDPSADALLARVSSSDPAAAFDASTLSASLVDDAVTRGAAKPSVGFAKRQTTRLVAKFAETYRARPRFVLGSSLSAVAGVAAIALVGSVAFGSHAQSPLFSLAGQAQGGNSENKVAADSALAPGADMSIMRPFVSYHYTAADGLSNDGGSSHVYQLALVDDPKSFLKQLADVLNVQGTVHKGQYSDLTTNPDETAMLDTVPGKSALSMSTSYTGNWWFSSWQGSVVQACPSSTAPASKSSTEPSSTSVAPTAGSATSDSAGDPYSCPVVNNSAVNTLSKAEAREAFIKLMDSTGFAFSASDVEVYADSLFTTATAQYKVQINGETIDTGMYFSAEWGSDGKLVSASGNAVKLVDAGSFDTISPAEAVSRANDEKWASYLGFGGPMMGMVEGDVRGVPTRDTIAKTEPGIGAPIGDSTGIDSVPAPPATDTMPEVTAAPAPGDDPATGSTGGASGGVATAEPMPTDTYIQPTPTVQNITIDKVKRVWMQLTDAKGGVWLVLGYQLLSGDTTYSTVPAIADGLIGF